MLKIQCLNESWVWNVLWLCAFVYSDVCVLKSAAQHQVSSGDPSEQEVRFSGMAYHHPDQC